jgi:hypothetical protein
MTTTPKPPIEELDNRSVSCSPPVEAFFARLSYEHTRFLDAVAEAAASLEDEPAGLAEIAARHARLAQQLLDAQRSIMRRKAEVTAIVASISAVASSEARDLVDAAFGEAETMCGGVDEILSTGSWGMRASSQRESATLLDDAREFEEPPGARAEHQLRALLDEWWIIVQDEAQAEIEDARGRAAVERHLAEIEAGEILEAARALSALDTPPVEMIDPANDVSDDVIDGAANDARAATTPPARDEPATTQPPSPMLIELGAAIDAVDHTGLGAVLASLIDALQVPPGDKSPDANTDEASIAEDQLVLVGATDSAISPGPGSQEAFDHFWHARHDGRSAREWVFVQVLLPMVAVVAVLALVLAWIG